MMLRVSIIVEILRAKPRLVLWIAALSQAAVWWLVPTLFYASPPGDLPHVLAVGREFAVSTPFGPPLAYWAAEIAYRTAGAPGVYLLAQACIVTTYWAVFQLGRSLVGLQHAALAVLLMAGLTPFTVPSPAFGPAIAAMPLSALALLHFWQAIGERRRGAFFALALDLGLLLLVNDMGVFLALLMLGFCLATPRGREAFRSADPYIAAIVVLVMLLPYLLVASGEGVLAFASRLQAEGIASSAISVAEPLVALAVAPIGLGILAAVASGWRLRVQSRAATFVRTDIEPFAEEFVLLFALAPPVIATVLAMYLGLAQPAGGLAPHLVLLPLAVVVAAGSRIDLQRQRIATFVWSLLIVVPPALAAFSTIALPWITGTDLAVVQPARRMGQFFAQTFERRVGWKLPVVAGDGQLAELIALGAPSRPHVYADYWPARTPWLSPASATKDGAIVVWRATDTVGAPPAAVSERFPDLVAELPQTFVRRVEGRLAPLRVGWGMVRPAGAPAAPVPPAAPQ